LAYNFCVAPFLTTFLPTVRMLDTEGLIGLIFTMLGSSGIRTFERVKGIGPNAAAAPMISIKDDARVNVVQAPAEPAAAAPIPTNEEQAPWNR
jgi:hypothetical protein